MTRLWYSGQMGTSQSQWQNMNTQGKLIKCKTNTKFACLSDTWTVTSFVWNTSANADQWHFTAIDTPRILSCVNFPSNSTYLNLNVPTLTFHIPKCFVLVLFFLFNKYHSTIIMVHRATNNIYTVNFYSHLKILQK